MSRAGGSAGTGSGLLGAGGHGSNCSGHRLSFLEDEIVLELGGRDAFTTT